MNATLGLQRIGALLSPGESLRWSGAPAAGIRFRSVDIFLVPFSLLWGGFAFVWETLALTTHGPILMKLWGIPFVLVGSYLIFGRFIYDAYIRSHTTYAVSDRAAYVVTNGYFPSTIVFTASSMTPLELKTEADMSGSIHFGPRSSFGSRGAWNIWVRDNAEFTGIANVATVYEFLRAIV